MPNFEKRCPNGDKSPNLTILSRATTLTPSLKVMPVRRAADPSNVQHIWNAIRSANAQRQVADLPRIIKFLQKFGNCSHSQAVLYVQQTLQDGLVVAVQKTGQKGSKTGIHIESYRIPVQELTTPVDDGRDWYCIECHLAGDVTPCTLCHRVFHPECSTNARHKQMLFQNSSKRLNNFPNNQTGQSIDLNRTVQISEGLNTHINDQNILDISGDEYNERFTETHNTFDEIEKQLSNLEDPSSSNNISLAISNSNRFENELNSSKVVINISDDEGGNRQDLENDYIYDESICSICNLFNMDDDITLEKEELNHLLSFILERIRSWLPSNLTHTMSPDDQYEWLTESELSWRSTQLFYQHMDMNVMELKIQAKEYTRLGEFQADVITIQHNVSVFHGIESQEYGAAELMLRDCRHDISELKLCVDCYRHSNEKINSKWFSLPCRTPHRLVWAKQKGYPYWPAKVIKETESHCDVRFFGGKYERSILPKNFIKPITVNMQTLQIKRSLAFNKALEELHLHQKLLENPNEVAKILSSKPRRKLLPSKPKKPTEGGVITVAENISPDGKSAEAIKDVYEFQEIEYGQSNLDPRQQKRKNILTYVTNSKVKRKEKTPGKSSSPEKQVSPDIIPISDAEEDVEFSVRDSGYGFGKNYDGSLEQVSSSTEFISTNDDGFSSRDNSDNVMQQLDQPYSDSVEKMRRKLEQSRDKKQLIKLAMDCMQIEIDRITNEHNEHLKKLFEAHNTQISETKKKQWCYNCEQDAIYHCCWNTAYCSPTCQQQHWQAEHKKVCRRKR